MWNNWLIINFDITHLILLRSIFLNLNFVQFYSSKRTKKVCIKHVARRSLRSGTTTSAMMPALRVFCQYACRSVPPIVAEMQQRLLLIHIIDVRLR